MSSMFSFEILTISMVAVFFLGWLLPIIWKSKLSINSDEQKPTKWLSPQAKIGLILASLGSGVAIFLAVDTMLKNQSPFLRLGFASLQLPDQGDRFFDVKLTLQLDSLARFFVLLIAGFSLLVAIYSWEALRVKHYQPYQQRIVSAFNLFVIATLLSVMAADGFTLLLSLEIMTLAFAYLALYKHNLYEEPNQNTTISNEKRKDARLAPQVYLMISHTSTVLLLATVLLLGLRSGSLEFSAWAGKPEESVLESIIFFLALAALGIRAGLVPFHFWVSLVHPNSPTTTHALSLGIAIKVAVYLMFRFFFQFLVPQSWWGGIVLLVAVGSALVTVWYAISSHDLKTALAYHSIENIGIIVTGLGVALIFAPSGGIAAQCVTLLALLASLYHLMNHATFKGLLYLATGAIDNLTHQRVEFHYLGGLLKLYPFTGGMFLVGAFAISGFPPLNGFISEWLMVQAMLSGANVIKFENDLILFMLVCGLILLVASFALTAFCFYKIAGLSLLGQPRTSEVKRNVEQSWYSEDVGWAMKAPMAFMAGLCMFLGLFPGLTIPFLVPVLGCFPSIDSTLVTTRLSDNFVIQLISSETIINLPIYPVLAFIGASLIITLAWGALRGRKPLQSRVPWSCGSDYQAETTQYTSSAVSFLLRDHLDLAGRLLQRYHRYLVVERERFQSQPAQDAQDAQIAKDADRLPAILSLSHSPDNIQEVLEVFRAGLNVVIHSLLRFSTWLGEKIQNKDIRRYLAYIWWINILILFLFAIMLIDI